jgi:hypothetical protein
LPFLGSNQPIDLDVQALIEHLEQPEVNQYLHDGNVNIIEIRHWLNIAKVTRWSPDTPRAPGEVNTDLFPRDEYYLNNELGKIQPAVPEVLLRANYRSLLTPEVSKLLMRTNPAIAPFENPSLRPYIDFSSQLNKLPLLLRSSNTVTYEGIKGRRE